MRLSTGDRHAKLGEEPAAMLSMSQRFRNVLHAADASVPAIQTASAFVETANATVDVSFEIIQRMMELAATSADGLKSDTERQSLDAEFKELNRELGTIARTSMFHGKQTVGRDTLVSYDANTDRVKFLMLNGGDSTEIERDFGATDLDALGNEIGFDATEDFSMSRDGRSLYFMGTVTGDPVGNLRIKRYDIDHHTVYTGADLFDTGDHLFVDESGDVTVNGNGTLYNVDSGTLGRTATAVVDMTAGSEYSIYKDNVTYYRGTDNNVVRADVASGTPTVLMGATVFAAGDHAFSASGLYMAEESPAGSVRVINTNTGNEFTLAIGAAANVNHLQFNEDGDRIYYVDDTNNTVHYLNVETDGSGNVAVSNGAVIAQGLNNNSFNGLDLGGSHFDSKTSFVVAHDSLSTLSYEAADLRLYALGLVNTRIDTLANANQAILDLTEATNRLNAQRAKLGATASRLQHTLDGQRSFISNVETIESQLRDTDTARESTRFASAQVRHQAAAAILAQFNTLSQNVLQLLQR